MNKVLLQIFLLLAVIPIMLVIGWGFLILGPIICFGFAMNAYRYNNQKELYFRVKVFDILKENNEWVRSPSNFLNRYNFNIRKQNTKYNYQITLKAHGKKWIPVLDYPKLKNKNLITNPYKFTTSSNLKVQTSKVFNFSSYFQQHSLNCCNYSYLYANIIFYTEIVC